MRIKILVFLVVAFLLSIPNGFCANSITDNVITTGLDNMVLAYWPGTKQVCDSMLEGIKANNYLIVEPIVRVDDYQNSALKVYTDKCPNLSLNKDVFFDPKIFDYAMTLPEKERDELGRVRYQTKDFRIYHIDLDGNPENGKEFVYYGAREQIAWSGEFIDTSRFKLVDFSSCKGGYFYSTGISLDENGREGIINYNGVYYIYSFDYSKYENMFFLRIADWGKRLGAPDRFSMICTFKMKKCN